MGQLPKLNADGTVVGDPFHFSNMRSRNMHKNGDYDAGYPNPKYGEETYREYRKRVEDNFVTKSFHLGDLSDNDYEIYCKGSGNYDDFDSDQIIK